MGSLLAHAEELSDLDKAHCHSPARDGYLTYEKAAAVAGLTELVLTVALHVQQLLS